MHRHIPSMRRQSGAFAVMFAAVLLVILGFCGLALDAGLLYNRKVDLHAIAKTVALAAARELNGDRDGVIAATAAASEAAQRLKYQYGLSFAWNNSAVTFSNTPARDAVWVSADSAKASPAGRLYVKVDTSVLDADIGKISTIFMHLLGSGTATASVSERAVAGRATINVLPFAICAMSDQAGAARTNPGPPTTVELVEYGFRRGISYDLMQLNPKATTPANFIIDPLAPPGGLGSPSNISVSAIGPFICTGRMWIPRLTGGKIRVTSAFPLASLYRQLNSRFDQYDGGVCNANGAPPDYNIKSYAFAEPRGVSWMTPKPGAQSALASTADGRLQTIADLSAPPAGTVRAMYGTLWSYAKPIKFSSYSPSNPDPTNASASFSTSDWASLYPTVPAPAANNYPAKPPYFTTIGDNYSSPSADHARLSAMNRRLLHVPLLACDPVPSGTNVAATALAIGRFFMTVPASATSIYAEFAGIVPENTLAGQVILYP
jgi:Flp pilus assembly protein TadG